MNPTVHTVASGETLSGIASKYGISYQDIAKANNIANPNLIYAGQKFTIPGKSAPAPAPTGATPVAPQATASQPSNPTDGGGGGTPPPYAPNTVNQTVDFGGITWKGNPGSGWTAQSQTGGGSVNGGAGTITATPTLDLVGLTESAYHTPEITTANSAIDNISAEIDARKTALATASSEINDNPFYSEATRVGKQAKLNEKAQADISNLTAQQQTAQGKLATLRADAEIKINAAKGQYDINNQASQQAFQQFSTLLQAGALDNASGTDIANITRATGVSSAMIKSAVDAQAKKDLKTSLIQFDDGRNQGYAVVNADTGEIINKQIIGPSKPPAATSGLAAERSQIELDRLQAPSAAYAAAKSGKTFGDMVAFYSQYGMSPQDILNVYNGVNYYKKPAQLTAQQKKAYGLK